MGLDGSSGCLSRGVFDFCHRSRFTSGREKICRGRRWDEEKEEEGEEKDESQGCKDAIPTCPTRTWTLLQPPKLYANHCSCLVISTSSHSAKTTICQLKKILQSEPENNFAIFISHRRITVISPFDPSPSPRTRPDLGQWRRGPSNQCDQKKKATSSS